MGGTGVALARDGAAPFLNPATIVRIAEQRLAFSVNLYSFALLHFSDWHRPGPVDTAAFGDQNLGGTGLTESNIRVLPSTLCLFFTLGDLAKLVDTEGPVETKRTRARRKLAICFASLESEDVGLLAVHFEGGTGATTTSQVQSVSQRWSRTYLGPTYSQVITPSFAIGASLQGVYTHDAFDIDGSAITGSLAGGAIDSTLGASGSGSSFELTANLGATYRVGDTTFGANVQPPSLHVYGTYNATYAQTSGGSAGDSSVLVAGTGGLRAPPPMRFSLGVGVEKPRYTVEVDGALDVPYVSAIATTLSVVTNRLSSVGVSTAHTDENYVTANHPTFNPSVGGEYFVSPSFSLLGGLAANLTSLSALTPAPSVGNLATARLSHASASFGIGSYGEARELLLGFQLDYGWGQELTINPYTVPNDWAVVNAQSYAVMFIISGATDLRSIEHAFEHVKNAVTTGDPDVPPPKAAPPPSPGP